MSSKKDGRGDPFLIHVKHKKIVDTTRNFLEHRCYEIFQLRKTSLIKAYLGDDRVDQKACGNVMTLTKSIAQILSWERREERGEKRERRERREERGGGRGERGKGRWERG